MMKKILIVDSNNETRKALAAGLGFYDGFRVLSKESAAMAAKLIETQHIDVLITEIDQPGMDGFKLISLVKKHRPDTQIVAIAELFTSQLLLGLKTLDVPHYLNKPVHMDSLVDFILEGENQNPQSRIHGVALASFLQLMNIEKKTCTLDVSTDKNQGRIFIQKGEVIGARTGELTGRQAFFKVMEWDTPDISLTEGCRAASREISQTLMHLLMESHQKMDESADRTSEPVEAGSPGRLPGLASEKKLETDPGSGNPPANPDLETTKINPHLESASLSGGAEPDGRKETDEPRDSGVTRSLSGKEVEDLIRSGPVAEQLQEMQAALYQIVGPMAKVIFRDAVREWLPSQNALEFNLSALVEVLTREIRDPDKEQQYVKMISPD